MNFAEAEEGAVASPAGGIDLALERGEGLGVEVVCAPEGASERGSGVGEDLCFDDGEAAETPFAQDEFAYERASFQRRGLQFAVVLGREGVESLLGFARDDDGLGVDASLEGILGDGDLPRVSLPAVIWKVRSHSTAS